MKRETATFIKLIKFIKFIKVWHRVYGITGISEIYLKYYVKGNVGRYFFSNMPYTISFTGFQIRSMTVNQKCPKS